MVGPPDPLYDPEFLRIVYKPQTVGEMSRFAQIRQKLS